MKKMLFVSLYILCFLGACDGKIFSPDVPKKEVRSHNVTFRIKGTITDATNNAPLIAEFWLMIGFGGVLTHVRSNDKGQYSLECTTDWEDDWPENWVWAYAEANGYKITYIRNVRLTEEWQTIDVQLERESTK